MDHGLLPACRESFHTYWTPLVMNTETVEDEEESVFFTVCAYDAYTVPVDVVFEYFVAAV